jgi:peptidoglycan/LPS O-acetylase OafA/YrhL
MHRRRNFGLDLARALAISMVFLLHGVTACEPLGVGVDLFFVLSGFLIGRIYLLAQSDATTPGMDKPGSFTLWAFWSARWLRTLPPYFAALGLCALLQMHFHNNAVHWYYLLFLQNYAGVDGFGPSWSLCVEEHFYLALPLLGFIALRFIGRRHLLWLLPALALVPEILRSALPLPPDWFWRTHLHAEGLLLGVWLAYVFVDRGTGPDSLWSRLQWPAMLLALIPLATLAYQFYHPTQPLTFQHSVFLLYAVGYSAWLRLFYAIKWNPRTALTRVAGRAISGLALLTGAPGTLLLCEPPSSFWFLLELFRVLRAKILWQGHPLRQSHRRRRAPPQPRHLPRPHAPTCCLARMARSAPITIC